MLYASAAALFPKPTTSTSSGSSTQTSTKAGSAAGAGKTTSSSQTNVGDLLKVSIVGEVMFVVGAVALGAVVL